MGDLALDDFGISALVFAHHSFLLNLALFRHRRPLEVHLSSSVWFTTMATNAIVPVSHKLPTAPNNLSITYRLVLGLVVVSAHVVLCNRVTAERAAPIVDKEVGAEALAVEGVAAR